MKCFRPSKRCRTLSPAASTAADGKPFARYPDDRNAAPPFHSPATWFEFRRLVTYRRIQLNGQDLGTIYVESDLNELVQRLGRFALVLLAILIGAAGLALMLSIRLQRVVSAPIAHLSGVAKAISTRKNYSVRAVKTSDDDLGRLIESFNAMLSEIELRDAELQAHRDRLESQVAAPHRRTCWRPRTAPRRQPRQKRVPGEHEPRNPHADERRYRHDRAAAGYPTHRRSAGVPGDGQSLRGLAAGRHQRHPGFFQDRSGQTRPGPAGVPSARMPGRRGEIGGLAGRGQGLGAAAGNCAG